MESLLSTSFSLEMSHLKNLYDFLSVVDFVSTQPVLSRFYLNSLI